MTHNLQSLLHTLSGVPYI